MTFYSIIAQYKMISLGMIYIKMRNKSSELHPKVAMEKERNKSREYGEQKLGFSKHLKFRNLLPLTLVENFLLSHLGALENLTQNDYRPDPRRSEVNGNILYVLLGYGSGSI